MQQTSVSEQLPVAQVPVEVTAEAAVWALARLRRDGNPSGALRLGVKGGGCEGYTYVVELASGAPGQREKSYEQHGLTVWLDERCLRFVEGATVVLHKSLMFTGLRFSNPKQATTCGCGETFSVKPE